MTHNEIIKTFDDIARYLELEYEHLEAIGVSDQSYIAKYSKNIPDFKKKNVLYGKSNDKKKFNVKRKPTTRNLVTLKRTVANQSEFIM